MTADDQARLDALTPDVLWALTQMLRAYGTGRSNFVRPSDALRLAALCDAVAAAQLVVQRDPDVELGLYSGQIGVERRHESGLVEWSTGAATLAAALGAVSETARDTTVARVVTRGGENG